MSQSPDKKIDEENRKAAEAADKMEDEELTAVVASAAEDVVEENDVAKAVEAEINKAL